MRKASRIRRKRKCYRDCNDEWRSKRRRMKSQKCEKDVCVQMEQWIAADMDYSVPDMAAAEKNKQQKQWDWVAPRKKTQSQFTYDHHHHSHSFLILFLSLPGANCSVGHSLFHSASFQRQEGGWGREKEQPNRSLDHSLERRVSLAHRALAFRLLTDSSILTSASLSSHTLPVSPRSQLLTFFIFLFQDLFILCDGRNELFLDCVQFICFPSKLFELTAHSLKRRRKRMNRVSRRREGEQAKRWKEGWKRKKEAKDENQRGKETCNVNKNNRNGGEKEEKKREPNITITDEEQENRNKMKERENNWQQNRTSRRRRRGKKKNNWRYTKVETDRGKQTMR